MRTYLKILGFLVVLLSAPWAAATKSAELLTAESYGYGRVEASVRFAAGDGVVSSVFLWKDGSERAGTFWNELDFEKLGADCRLETNPIYGKPAGNHSQRHALGLDLCAAFHTYAYEWTPEAIVWLVDGVEIRREAGAIAQAFAANASDGMQIHFNLWPGDATFGGNFNPAIVPVHQYVDWVQFSAYRGGAFELVWREDFDAASLPAGWLTGDWPSPKNKSTHAPENVNFIDGYAVLSLTADDALGPAGAMPEGSGGTASDGGTSSGGTSGSAAGSSLGARPNVDGCSFGRDREQSPALAPLGALALAFLSYRARRRDR
jgi:hypothetical protein